MSGWGYKIDYAKAIAEDRARLALYDSPLMKAISASLTEEECAWLADHYAYGVIAWVMVRPATREARAAITGTALEEFECGALRLEIPLPDLDAKPEPDRWYVRGGDVIKLFDHIDEIVTEEERRSIVKKAKTSLARHLRNHKTYGVAS